MKKQLLVISLLSLFICGCNSQANSNNPGVCNVVKHKIIFTGATNDPQKALVQRAELGNLDKTFKEENCK